MALPTVVTEAEWRAARDELLVKERKHDEYEEAAR